MPTVVVVTAPFESVARASADARGMTGLPIVVLPAGFDDLDSPRIDALVAECVPAVLQGLTRC